MSSGSVGRMASSAVVPAEAMDLSTGGDSSARPKVNQLRCSQISATSGHLVIDMGPTGTDDGGGGSTRPPIDVIRRPGVHLVLAFDDLTYSVKQPKSWFFHQSGRRPIDEMASGERAGRNNNNNNNGNTRTLLDGISGEAREGEILAVLGASGSGKSTLIDALAGRIQRSSLHGSVTLNGEPLDSNLLKVISAHVMQDDLLYPMLTVEETLTYSAELRLPRATPGSTKRARVQALIDQLGLRAAAHTIIGDEGRRGVSGGERRRVSIGVDVVHDPVVLFLDEPTSGLDSTSAFMVAKALRTIARSGSVVVMSIHQPSYRIVSLLDSLLFLSQGQTVYYGPPAGLPPFFSELDLGHTMIDGENPAEFALDTIRDLEGTPEDGTRKLVDLSKSWWQQKKAASVEELSPLSLSDAIGLSIARGKLVSSGTTGGDATNKNKVQLVSSYANPWWAEVCVLTCRALTNTWRTPELFLIRLAAVMATGLILATVFWRLDNTPKGVTERFGFFAISIATMFYASSDALPVFVADRYIFLRETAHNAYRRSSYALSNALAAFPPLLLLSLAFTAIVFPAVGLAGGAQGCAFFALVVLASFWAGSGFVTFLSAVVPHVIIGYTVVVAVLAYFLLFSGFLITRDRIQGYWIWFHYLSLIKYPYQAVMHNEFGADPAKCFMRGVQMFDGTPIGKMPEATKVNVLNAMSRSLRIDFNSTSCINTGADILAKQAVTDLGKWACVWVTVAWGFLFRVFFYIALLLGSKNKRA